MLFRSRFAAHSALALRDLHEAVRAMADDAFHAQVAQRKARLAEAAHQRRQKAAQAAAQPAKIDAADTAWMISAIADASCNSATETSSGPAPAISKQRCAATRQILSGRNTDAAARTSGRPLGGELDGTRRGPRHVPSSDAVGRCRGALPTGCEFAFRQLPTVGAGRGTLKEGRHERIGKGVKVIDDPVAESDARECGGENHPAESQHAWHSKRGQIGRAHV
mgnify:CR=1 FL=1